MGEHAGEGAWARSHRDGGHQVPEPGIRVTTEVPLCTFNGARFIVEQLQSILAQTVAVDRISIYDDQSTDDTVSRIRTYLASLPEEKRRLVTVEVNARNLGYARNFIHAIEKSSKDILFLCDQDDIWEPNKVEVFLAAFQSSRADMVFSDGTLIDSDGRRFTDRTVLSSYGLTARQISGFHDSGFKLLRKRNYVNGAAAAVRRVAALDALPLPCDMPHDYWLALWCAVHGGVAATSETLYRYRQHGNNVIGVGSDKLLHVWLGIWRHPVKPRERELQIWKAVSERMSSRPGGNQAVIAQRKTDWLLRVVPRDKSKVSRTLQIMKSALDGSYRTYSDTSAVFRDIVSLIR